MHVYLLEMYRDQVNRRGAIRPLLFTFLTVLMNKGYISLHNNIKIN